VAKAVRSGGFDSILYVALFDIQGPLLKRPSSFILVLTPTADGINELNSIVSFQSKCGAISSLTCSATTLPLVLATIHSNWSGHQCIRIDLLPNFQEALSSAGADIILISLHH
jgi:hypothetical protein